MKKCMLALVIMLMAPCAMSADPPKDLCTTSSVGGAIVISCPTYVVTKDTNGTTICRLPNGSPEISCAKVEDK